MDLQFRAGTPEWREFYFLLCDELLDDLNLSEAIGDYAKDLWSATVLKVPRAPLPLVVDCVYITAKMTGNRRSIRVIKKATVRLWGRKIDILPLDKRREEKRRWVWDKEQTIRSVLALDDELWDDFVSEWAPNGEEKIVADSYWEEE